MHSASQTSIDSFIDALWLEDGLSKNTLAAYRRDLSLYANWLGLKEQAGLALDETHEANLNAYFAQKHAVTKATSANRRLTVFKRYFRWALRERLIEADPTLKLQSARQALRVPKLMSEAQVDALLRAPDATSALGQRDRAMLELMYASGLRVSELVGMKTFALGLNEGVVRVTGKGGKERLVPFGQVARASLAGYLAGPRPAILGGQQTEDL
ncbi:MAG: site-specific integrase, partial [Polaromonas sp.]|nr:site-specific integrase [Polaromonas sp.]